MERGLGESTREPTGSTPSAFAPAPPFDIEVAFKDLPTSIPHSVDPRRWIHVADRAVLVRFPGDRRVLIEEGQRVTLHWPIGEDDVDHDHNWVIDSWAVPLAMMQRGFLPLHASTVQVGDAVVAVAGRSGSGKSTTAVGLSARGHEILVDETTLLQVTDTGVLMHPFPRRIHLTEPAAQRLGVVLEDTRPVAQSPGKVALTNPPRSFEPVPLTHVVALQASEVPEVEVQSLTGALSLAMLSVHAERMGVAPLVLGREGYLSLLRGIAERTSVVAVRRPSYEWSLDAVMDAIEALATSQPPR